jgi:hypothetical protein
LICDQDQTAADAGYTYKHTNGTQKQKWETFTDLADAKKRKKEVEYKESVGTFVAPQCRTLKDLLTEYVALYGKTKWAPTTILNFFSIAHS